MNYLTEYSGRRGIHVWIIFSHLIKKDKAFQILSFFRNKLLAQIGELCYANLDLFPATNVSKGNIVGKQVKMPLSCHRAGGRSWLCERDFIIPDLMDEVGFLAQQLDILSRYNVNDYQSVCESIDVNDEELIVRLKYRKYEINNDISLSIWETIEILSETKVYAEIFQRLMQGQALRNDWLVVLGTFSPLNDGGAFVTELYSIFPNYDVKKTAINIKKYREAYYPATFEYLYQIYGIEMEKNIEKNDTGFSYLLKRKGIVPKVDESNIINNKKRDDAISICDTVQKEIKYVLDNDEVLNISVWNNLNRIKATELFRLEKIVESLLGAEAYSFSWKPLAYVYQREESESKKRELVTLGALDRVLTTQIALILQKKLKSFWNSYSYNVSFGRIANLNVTEMSNDRVLVADLFYAALEAIQEIKGDYLENEVFDAFKNVSQIAKPGEESASLILVNFLNDLYQHRKGISSEIKISVDETIVLLKDLEPIKFIFLLCDEEGERYFPASRLLSNIVLDPTFISSKIELYHINLLQLAVEMYKITGGVNPQEQFEKLIDNCQF